MVNVRNVLGTQIYYADHYEPYHGGQNRRFQGSEFSQRVLNLKSKHIDSVEREIPYFADLVRPFLATLPTGLVLCHVPSHEAQTPSPGLARLLEKVARPGDEVALELITRTRSIAKLATGGERIFQVHFESLSISAPAARDRRILVLDDVTKTGNSLLASRKLLKEAGSNEVFLLALGKVRAP